MRRMLIALAGTALTGLALVAAPQAQAQSQEELCAGFQDMIDMGTEAGTPFAEIAAVGQELKDAFCDGDGGGGGEDGDGGGDEGGEEPNPLCAAIDEILTQFEDNDAPEEMTSPLRELHSAGCAASEDDPEDGEQTENTTPDTTTTTAPPTTTTTAAVAGVTAAQTGTPLPATGGGLLAAGLGGGSLLALAALVRRLLAR